jgi:Tol biopolymer transport system component
LASIIVLVTAVAAFTLFARSHSHNQQNFAPSSGQQAVSPVGDAVLFSEKSGNSSFLYRRESSGKKVRLTPAQSGVESEASFSHDGRLVVYSFAADADSKSEIWVVDSDGNNPHAITGKSEDALHPMFSPYDSKVFYAVSSVTGNYSPVVRPARHDWDVYSIAIHSSPIGPVAAPIQITHSAFYDLRSLDVVAEGITPGATKLLISTTGYPIGALFEEFILGATGRDKIFQPHVLGESSVGPSYGDVRFTHDGMDLLFLAATDGSDGKYDYNIYSMSDVTGSEIKQLTHLKGMTKELKVLPNGNATFVNGGVPQVLDVNAQTVKPL